MNRPALILLFAILMLPAPGRALTMEECYVRAVVQNSALKSSAAAAEAVREDVSITRAALLPSLKLKGFFTLADNADRLIIDSGAFGANIPSEKVTVSTGQKNSYSASLSLRQPLFVGGRLASSYVRARHESAASAYAHSRQRTLLFFQVRKTFSEALIASCRIGAAEKALQAADERLRVSKARQEEGYADREELLRREADIAMAQTRLIKARNRSALVLSRLRQLIGAKPDEELEVSGKPEKLTLTAELNDLLQGGIERREDIKSALEKTAASNAGVRTARSGYYPQLFLEGNYLRQRETNFARPEIWTATLQAEWSLFEWGRTTAEVSKAVAQRSQLDLAREELSRSARFEIEETWRDVIEQQSLVVANEKGLKAGEAAFLKILDKYSEGAVRHDDVITSEAALWDAYDSYSQSAAALSSAFAALEAAASVSLDRWTVMEELYRPDFEGHASRIKEHADFRQKQLIEKQAVPTMNVKADQVRPVGYLLQFGAYKSMKNAQERLSSVATRFTGKKLELLAEGGLFKPTVGSFAGFDEAQKAAEASGLKEYIIRGSHGPRTVSP